VLLFALAGETLALWTWLTKGELNSALLISPQTTVPPDNKVGWSCATGASIDYDCFENPCH
jgi:hypothetical protein